jgi:hypothetical protein
MYTCAKVIVQRPQVRALPAGALAVLGHETFCYLLEGGKAVKTPVQRGMRDGTWVEVLKKKIGDSSN